MAKLNLEHRYPTLEAIDPAMEAAQERSMRPYLGMSAIGFPCHRRLWLDLRFTAQPFFKAATLRKFEDGFFSEDVMAKRLKLVAGVTLLTTNEVTGKQIGFTDVNGHVRGHVDGMIIGLLEAPNTWHVWEHKSVDDASKNKLERLVNECEETALQNWNPQYYDQAVYYMRSSKTKRHFLTVSSAGCRTAISVRTHHNPEHGRDLHTKAQRIVKMQNPPDKIATDKDYFLCKHMCGNAGFCHGTDAPMVTCRSCIHIDPYLYGDKGSWECKYFGNVLPTEDQHRACPNHVYIPSLLQNWALVKSVDVEENAIEYVNQLTGKTFWNGRADSHYSSLEISVCADKRIIGDPDVDLAKQSTGGRLHD